MSKLEDIKFKNLDVVKTLAFLKLADIEIKQCLEISDGNLISRGHPPTKNFVSFHSTESSSIFKEIDPAESGGIRICLIKLKTFIDILELYKSSKVLFISGVMICKKEDGYHYVINIKFKEKKLNTTVKCIESYITPIMDKEIWQKFSNTNDPILNFSLDKESLKQIKKLSALYLTSEETPIFNLKLSENNLIFASKTKGDWEMVVKEDLNNKRLLQGAVSLTVFKYIETELPLNCFIVEIGNSIVLLLEQNQNSKFVVAIKLD
jgi:hypothetical protein